MFTRDFLNVVNEVALHFAYYVEMVPQKIAVGLLVHFPKQRLAVVSGIALL